MHPRESLLQFLLIQHIIHAVTHTVDRTHASVQFQILHILQQIQNRYFTRFHRRNLQHLRRVIDSGHIVSLLRHQSCHLAGTTSEIKNRSIRDPMLRKNLTEECAPLLIRNIVHEQIVYTRKACICIHNLPPIYLMLSIFIRKSKVDYSPRNLYTCLVIFQEREPLCQIITNIISHVI